MRILISAALVLALATPALACINDSELISHEREFRSQYQESNYQPPQPEQVSSARPYILGSTGMLMTLVGAGLFVRLRGKTV
ncbi:MAG TPA: hypothetical protein VKD71_07750 [Gemmataceae bacterium]|nr:hypothetical protein [Gemmataceae bacterium]